MTATHTPGPWAIIADVPGHEIGYRAIVAVKDGEPAETICNPSPMGAANAALIAAAPEMFAALEAIFGIALDGKSHFHSAELIRVMGKERFDAARAALAKATGA